MSEVKVNKITPTTNCGTVTLGDSGDTISIPAGASLSIGGTVSGIEGIVNWDTTAKTSGFTAVAGTGYFVNTTSGPITVTLPATPTAGDLVAVKDYAFTADTNNITLARNGSNIQGVANDFTINTEGRSVTLIYVDGTQGWLLTGASQKSDISNAQFVTATGGTVSTCGDYKIHVFTGPGTFCVSCAGNACGSSTVDYLVVAGGGGAGGTHPDWTTGGGGGAGGFRASGGTASGCYTVSPLGSCVSALPVSVTGYPITVGAGGTGSTGQPGPGTATGGTSGSNSIFSTITAAGGGRGASYNQAGGGEPALAGGSGGGGCGLGPGTAQPGNSPPVSPPQGNPGGTGKNTSQDSTGQSGGGGGGAGAAGANSGPLGGRGGPGGVGSYSNITTSPSYGTTGPVCGARYYAGGGGGGGGFCIAAGGAGGGAPGAGTNGPGGTGDTNTGGGGGGSASRDSAGGGTVFSGGAGGSGIVIIRYKYQ